MRSLFLLSLGCGTGAWHEEESRGVEGTLLAESDQAAGETLLWNSGCDHLVIRTSWLYSPWGKNFVRTMVDKMTQLESVKVVQDQQGRPTSAAHLAEVSLSLYTIGARGTYHVCDGGICTWYDFALEIARQAQLNCSVRACTSDEFPRPATRPAYSVLDVSNTEALVASMPDWKTNLARVLEPSISATSVSGLIEHRHIKTPRI